MAIALRAIAYDRFAGCGFTVSGCTVYHGLLIYGLSLIIALRSIDVYRFTGYRMISLCWLSIIVDLRFIASRSWHAQGCSMVQCWLAGHGWSNIAIYCPWLALSATLARDIMRYLEIEGL